MQTYSQAEEEYNIGNFHEADSILDANMSSYSTTLKASAYRLRALCSLLNGDKEKAREHAQQMFRANPYYTASVYDPPRFVDLVEEMKQGGARVSTASQQAETLDEVPVPVTVITEDMIESSGARTLQDLLLLYVPGMSLIEGPEANISMHGVYSAAQEKILIMLDGHRLNSRVTNSEAPDYRTSLDKIKQIEVLRGPASSLYGNVALTAVVNIITKKGHEMDGANISAGIGSNNTFRADFTMGKEAVGLGYSLWASIFTSDGEQRSVNPEDDLFYGMIQVPGTMYINGYNHQPSYDIGFTGQYKNFNFLFNMQNSKRVTPYIQLLYPGLYDYDKYRNINGVKPGRDRKATHMELSYDNSFGKLSLKVNAFADFESNTYYDVIADTINSINDANVINGAAGEMIDSLINELLVHRGLKSMFDTTTVNAIIDKYAPSFRDSAYAQKIQTIKGVVLSSLIIKRGLYQVQSWNDYTYGGSIQLNYDYKLGRITGNILGGIQAENYVMQNNSLLFGDDYTHVLVTLAEGTHTLALGHEYVISPFLQIKSYLTDRLIFNGGLRYDHKRRYNERNLDALSPRVSLIYRINNEMNAKLGYARSFVDAPYFYRANKLGAYPGGENLEAETMHAVQLDFRWKPKNTGLAYEANIYYNSLSDLIFYDNQNDLYINAGHMKMIGIENSLLYATTRSLATLNATYQRVVSSNDANVTNKHINNYPDFIATASYRYRIFDTRLGRLSARANATFYSKQYSPITSRSVYRGDELCNDENYQIPARLTLNAGLDYKLKPLTLSFSCYNLLGAKYLQGGSSNIPVPQEQRTVMLKLSCKL